MGKLVDFFLQKKKKGARWRKKGKRKIIETDTTSNINKKNSSNIMFATFLIAATEFRRGVKVIFPLSKKCHFKGNWIYN